MKPELDQKLCAKYPKMFVNRDKSKMESCMHWGFSHGDGWYNIIDSMCEAMTYGYTTSVEVSAELGVKWGIEPTVWNNEPPRYFLDVEPPQVVVDQVKEKYGTLRFYHHLEFEPRFCGLAYGENKTPAAHEIAEGYSQFIDGIIHYAEVLSGRTCEETGKEGEMHVGNGWYRTLNREYAKGQTDRNWIAVADVLKKEETP